MFNLSINGDKRFLCAVARRPARLFSKWAIALPGGLSPLKGLAGSILSLALLTPCANAQIILETDPFAQLRQTTGTITGAQIDPQQQALDNNRIAAQRSNLATGAVEPGIASTREDPPYAPQGIEIGSLRLTTFFKQSLGYTTNASNSAGGEGRGYSISEADLKLRSQWSRHQLEINANTIYKADFGGEPGLSVDIDGSLRLDLIDLYTATFGGSYNFENESATSISLTDTTINQPGVNRYGAFGQLQRSGHRLDLTLRGSIERSLYDDAKLSGGGTMSQRDRNLTNYQLMGRLGYQTGLVLSPFIEATYNIRDFDLAIDRNGQNRDNTALQLRGGIVIDLGEKISGEISAGYISQNYTDPGLAALAGFVINADLNWSPERDTNINLALGSSLGGSTTTGDSGAITHNGVLSASRRVRDNLEIDGSLSVDYTNYEGLGRIDTTYSAELGFEHWINRTMSLTGKMEYTNRDSTGVSNSYEETEFLLGLKFQR